MILASQTEDALNAEMAENAKTLEGDELTKVQRHYSSAPAAEAHAPAPRTRVTSNRMWVRARASPTARRVPR